MELEGKTALVTGAARGIGRVIALTLAEAGADVAVADALETVQETAEAVRGRGRASGWAVFDVASPEAVAEGTARLREAVGDFDVLVSNAGIVAHVAPLLEMTAAGWERELAVNLGGAFHVLQAVLPAMVAKGWGRVVLVSSGAAKSGLYRQAAYAASKAGLLGLMKTVTLEHARHGVTCNAILPGLIETENVRRMPAEIREATAARTPARRLGAALEVARLVAFLASDAAGFVNGAEIPIDGGLGLGAVALGSRREAAPRDP